MTYKLKSYLFVVSIISDCKVVYHIENKCYCITMKNIKIEEKYQQGQNKT
jgi:hypothetical protein